MSRNRIESARCCQVNKVRYITFHYHSSDVIRRRPLHNAGLTIVQLPILTKKGNNSRELQQSSTVKICERQLNHHVSCMLNCANLDRDDVGSLTKN